MQVIGVIDLLGRRAVHARAGRREHYLPVRAVAGIPIESGDAVALARAYVGRLGITEIYVADLDAILGRRGDSPSAAADCFRARSETPDADQRDAGGQDALVSRLATISAPVWLDAGVRSADDASYALELGIARVVVGLETLPSYEVLEHICATVSSSRAVFSLDLRNGVPITAPGMVNRLGHGEPAQEVAARAASAGVGAMIVLDLARVGTGAGPDLGLIASVRKAVPRLMLLAGGGIRGPEDLGRLADVGCDGALVATALLDGRLGTSDIAAARGTYNPTR